MVGEKKYLPVSRIPRNSSRSRKLEKKSLNEKDGVAVVVADMFFSASPYFQIDQGDWIHRPTTTSQTSVTGMKIFQPKRMIWS